MLNALEGWRAERFRQVLPLNLVGVVFHRRTGACAECLAVQQQQQQQDRFLQLLLRSNSGVTSKTDGFVPAISGLPRLFYSTLKIKDIYGPWVTVLFVCLR